MMVVAGVLRAAMMADKPTAPAPMTTIDSPGSGFAVLNTAPAPVVMQQASGPRSVRSMPLSTLTTALTRDKDRVAIEDRPKQSPDNGEPAADVQEEYR